MATEQQPAPAAPGQRESLDARTSVEAVAGDLRVVVGQLVRRFRQDGNVPQPQIAALGWLSRQGPKTTSQLAALERVRPQSMAQTVALLEDDGLVARRPDPSDGRQTIIELTERGRATLEELRVRGEAWVSDAIHERLSPEEQEQLAAGVALLSRLLDPAQGEPPR